MCLMHQRRHRLTEPPGQGCIADLRVTDPRLDMTRLQDCKGPLIKECYEWIFDHPDFTAWRKHDRNSVLWVSGDPGKGKTMLMMGIIHALSQLKSDANPIYVSYFFCERADPRLNSATAVLRSHIYMMVMERPELLVHFEDKYNFAGRQLFEDANAFYALSEIFKDIVSDMQVVLVVDAIDECKDGRSQLLELIDQTKYTSSKAKWVISSRNRPDNAGKRTESDVVNLDLDVNWRYVSIAVETYLNQKLPVLANVKGYDGQIYHTVRECLQVRTEETFLWVSAVCSALESTPRRKALSVLKRLPGELRNTYQQMLNDVRSMDDAEDTDLCMRMLAAMASSRRPMRLVELAASAGLPSDCIKDHDSLVELVYLCGSFLTIRGEAVYVTHSSARKFLATEVFSRDSNETSQTGGRFLPMRPDTSPMAAYK
ncbi:hypothetical protein PHISP_02147 [Aspergillus sp. HF37]|nr:hypothetical protein PHISP_02147 [Aspergillus sp. HF37]